MRLLVLGFGYSARHSASFLRAWARNIVGTTRDEAKAERMRAHGYAALVVDGNGQAPELEAAIEAATHVLVSAAPEAAGDVFLNGCGVALRRAARAGSLGWIGYYSTVGVYGDAGGGEVDDAAPVNPVSERSRWRAAAEEGWNRLGAETGVPVALLRLAGIYGPGRNALVNLAAGTARRIIRPGQVFNRIEVGDIAVATAAAALGRIGGPINVSDDEPSPPQDPIAFAAGLMGVPVPPEIPFAEARLSPMAASFWGENKRVINRRLKQDLRVELAAPSYREGLTELWTSRRWAGDDEDRAEASPRFRRTER